MTKIATEDGPGTVLAAGGSLARTACGLARRFREPEPVQQLRVEAAAAYEESAMPDRVRHLWRYTDPRQFAPGDAASRAGGGAEPHPAVHLEVSPDARERGVLVMDLHEALRKMPGIIQKHLGRIIGAGVDADGRGKFEALNLALWSTGVLVHVPRGVRVADPVSVRVRVPDGGPQGFLAARLLVVLEEDSELTLIDECEGGGGSCVFNSVAELAVGPGARLTHVAIQRLERSVKYHAAQRASVARDARMVTAMASLGSGVTKADFGSLVEGPGAEVELFGFLFGEGSQHFDHHTVHDHRAGHAASNLDFKAVLKDTAQSAYTGLIRIEPGAPASTAYQENRNLLLDAGARAESIPELEILTDDVRCSHGATVGTVDPEQIYYMACRGIERGEAIRLIVRGFVEPTLSRLPAEFRERLSREVQERIAAL